MLKRVLAVSLTVGMAAALISSCGDNSSTELTPPPPKGALYTFASDAPVCDILSFRMLVTGIKLRHETGGEVPVLPSSASIRVNFAELRDGSTVLGLESLPTGKYDQATLTVGVPEIVVFDASQSPPIKAITANITNSSPKITIDPQLEVTKDKVSALRVDLDLPRSVELDAQGEVTGKVTLDINVAPVTASGPKGFGAFEQLPGFVRSVTPSSATDGATGSFLFQLLGGTGPTLSVNVSNTTQVFGIPVLKDLLTGSYVEVDGFLNADGQFMADSMEVEDRELVEDNRVAMIGPLLSVTKDSSGQATQFSLLVRTTEPGVPFDINPDSVVIVTPSSSATYHFSSRATNFANLPVDATSLGVGQEVVVHGKFTKTTDQPTAVAADSIYLKMNTVQGNFAALLQRGSDDKTGAFRLAPCSNIFQQTPILVFTNSDTAFVNVSGLGALTAQPLLLIRGLLFFDHPGRTINGVTVPADSWVLLAKQVHQF